MYYIKYNRFPNNEIRATLYSVPDRKKSPARPILLWVQFCILLCACPEFSSLGESQSPPLDISSDFSQRSESKVRRKTKFGLNAKRTLLRLGGAYDTLDKDPSKFIFLTGTIPGGTHAAFSAVAEESSFIIKTISDWLSRTAPSEHWFYVWELQRRGALHIHYCIYPNNPTTAEKILTTWRGKWEDILDKVSVRRQVDVWERKDGTHHKEGRGVLQAYAQRVHKSVAAYLSGYCGGSKDKHSLDKDSPYYPTRWWGCSRKSINLLKALTEEVLVPHTNYRTAQTEIDQHYERVLHDSPKVHRYPHKAGVGSTVVSYHPQDKGSTIWQPLNPMLYKRQTHPSTSFMIQEYRTLSSLTLSFLEACPNSIRKLYRPLLMTLRDSCFPGTAVGYTFSRRDFRIIASIPSELTSALVTVSAWEKLRIRWCLLQATVSSKEQLMRWDRFGYLCTEDDCLGLLDNHWTKRYLGTNPDDGQAHGGDGIASREQPSLNGTDSPPSPTVTQLCLLSDS